MTYKEIQSFVAAKAKDVKDEVTAKIFTDAGFPAEYGEETLYAEFTEFTESNIKIVGSNFTFSMHIGKCVPGTHIILFVPRKELNSNCYVGYDDRYINKISEDLQVANRLIKSILQNKELIAEKAFNAYNSIDMSDAFMTPEFIEKLKEDYKF